jgi:hypothetical protein
LVAQAARPLARIPEQEVIMFNSSVLDVAMGLMFVYLILGLMCTTVHEWIAQLFKMRSQILRKGINALLNSGTARAATKDLAQDFYNHTLIKSLSKQGGDPSYVPARTFSLALVDILGGKSQLPPVATYVPPLATPQPMVASRDVARLIAAQIVPATTLTPIDPLTRVKAEIDRLPESDVKKALLLMLHDADNQLAVFERNLEAWFEDAMDRVSGWYKKRSQIIAAVVAVVITIFANADSVGIARKLFVNPTLREKIVRNASTATAQPSTPDPHSSGLTPEETASLGELTGWSEEFKTFHWMKAQYDKKSASEIDAARTDDAFPGVALVSGTFFPWLWAIAPAHLFGWLLTAIAASLGAPFWFDTLNRFMNIRAAGTAPNEKGGDRSKT